MDRLKVLSVCRRAYQNLFRADAHKLSRRLLIIHKILCCFQDGQRTNKYTQSSETLYFNKMWTLHTDSGNNVYGGQTAKNIYLGETRIVTKLNSGEKPTYQEEYYKQYFYHSDHLGSASLISDYKGEEYQRIEYTPYGETWVEKTQNTGLKFLPYKFTGKEIDEETGLYYYGARYLDPKYSMWISTDPALGEYIPKAPIDEEAKKHNQNLPGMGGVFNHINGNLYHYAANNPVRYIDPDGRNDDFTPDEKKFIIESQDKATSNLNLLISRIQKYNNNDKELEQSVFDYLGLDINKEKDKQYLLNSLTLIRDDLKNMTINDYAKNKSMMSSVIKQTHKNAYGEIVKVEYLKTISLSSFAVSRILQDGLSAPLHAQLIHETSHKMLHTDDIGYAIDINVVNDIPVDQKIYNADNWTEFYLQIMGR